MKESAERKSGSVMSEKEQNFQKKCLIEMEQMHREIEELRRELEKEKELRRLGQLELLQVQVDPHFLYNTLDAIVWLVEAGKQQEAVEMLSQLSLFFRIALSKGQDIIRLKEEIDHTRSYMNIQQMCYGDSMDYKILLPKELEEVRIPKLTIQPLVENALYHGVREKRGKSTIKVTCQEQEENILIIVEDDGKGMQPSQKAELENTLQEGGRVGFGAAAVHERIKLYFGKEYGIKIYSEYGEGTRVEIRFPKEIRKG